MAVEMIDTVIVGGGQAGLAMSKHLRDAGVDHLVLERGRIAERWRTHRWDSLVANGPAWHDRFPAMEFQDTEPDAFATRDSIVRYFEAFAASIEAPVRCGVDVLKVTRASTGIDLAVETSDGVLAARNVVAATGPFQVPVIPPIIPETPGITQMHSTAYRNPGQLVEGAVMVIGAGSSGSQIADELLRAGRKVYLSVGPHDRPPRRYRGKDFVWWLGVLGKWEMKTPPAGREHVTIAVSGAHGGHTVDFRRFAERGMILLGMTRDCDGGVVRFREDLATNIANGDANLHALLDEADAYVDANGLDLPEEPDARTISPSPPCITDPISELELAKAGVSTIIWATGFKQDFGWLQVNTLDDQGRPRHQRGVSSEPGVYFLGLPWLSMRGSSFIWGVWVDAAYLAEQIVGSRRTDVARSEPG